MPPWINKLVVESGYFMPHGHCYLWIPSLLWLHVISDALIGTAYVGISLLLWLLVRRLRLPFSPVFVAFGLFIGLCGGTHFMSVWTVWQPDYWSEGLLKAATALASVATAVGLLFIKPQVESVVRAARVSEERRVRLESTHAELEVLYRKLTELDELKSQFFANVSHELRTPLALILGPAQQLLADATLTPAQHRALQSVHDNGQALLKQVNDLLDLSKLEAGRMVPQYVRLDLAPWLRRVASHFELVAEARGIALQMQAPASLAAEVDADKLERVLVNLLGNAFKFTPDVGRVRTSLGFGADTLRIEVADSGPGVPAAQRELIFERFRQGEGGAARSQGGTGLGLAIVQDFVTLLRGQVRVGDAPEGGALFTIELPRQAPAGTPVGDAPERPDAATRVALEGTLHALAPHASQPARRAEPQPPGAARVLVVEDNAEMRAFVTDVLSADHSVSSAADGAEGLAQAEALQPDLIVTDVMMPRMSGDQLVRALRERTAFAFTPILLLTARADDALRVRLLAEGAQDWLTKPFLPAELRARVANLVAAKRAGDTLRASLASLSTSLEGLAQDLAIKHRHLQTALDAAEVAREQAERASRAKSTFLGMLSHEMRTPLAVIHMNLQLLSPERAPELPPALQTRLGRVRTATHQLQELIEGLLEYTRIESGRLQAQREPVDLQQLAAQTVEQYQLMRRTPDVQLTLAADGTPLPPLHSDARLLKIVLDNLVGNAVKFTERGSITVRLGQREGQVLIEVTDTGMGIAADALQRIFLPFEQLELHARRSAHGVGLGLTLVQHIVQALGGAIEVDSALEAGSTFRVLLPLDQPPATTNDNV